jgi:PAS domain S-box-containing protein
MKQNDEKFEKLRKFAEDTIKRNGENSKDLDLDINELIHEIHVHQVELEVQNEELKKAELKLSTAQKRYFEFYELSPVGYFTIDPDGLITDVNLAGTKLLDLKKDKLINNAFIRFIIPECHNVYYHHIKELIKTGKNQDCEVILNDGRVNYIHIESKPFFDETGNIKEILLTAFDISKLKKSEIRLKDSLSEKEVIFRELNHRVKNNLQIIASLMHLQEVNTDNDETVDKLRESESRVKTMAIIHEKLYESPDFADINFKLYIDKLIYDILYTYGKNDTIKTHLNIEDINLNIDTAIPLGLIINELVTNSVKYAFPDSEGTITITLKSINNEMELIVADDGIGINKEINFDNLNSLGLEIVKNLVNQLNGTIEMISDGGTVFKIRFKELKYKNRY